MVWDTIRARDVGREGPVQEWGGIAYALAAADVALGRDWSLFPIIKIGRDMREAADVFLATLGRLDSLDGVRTVPEPNNRVELVYRDDARRCERLTGGVPGWTTDEVVPLARSCDAVYVNFIAGWELDLPAAAALRSATSGSVYADLHSLMLGVGADGVRAPRPLADRRAWLSCFDIVQLNEDELATLAVGWEDRLGAGRRCRRPGHARASRHARRPGGRMGLDARLLGRCRWLPRPPLDAVEPHGGTRKREGRRREEDRGRRPPRGAATFGGPPASRPCWGEADLERSMRVATRAARRKRRLPGRVRSRRIPALGERCAVRGRAAAGGAAPRESGRAGARHVGRVGVRDAHRPAARPPRGGGCACCWTRGPCAGCRLTGLIGLLAAGQAARLRSGLPPAHRASPANGSAVLHQPHALLDRPPPMCFDLRAVPPPAAKHHRCPDRSDADPLARGRALRRRGRTRASPAHPAPAVGISETGPSSISP